MGRRARPGPAVALRLPAGLPVSASEYLSAPWQLGLAERTIEPGVFQVIQPSPEVGFVAASRAASSADKASRWRSRTRRPAFAGRAGGIS
jgi:hypothetical protein